jgi:thioredoxin reductase (NADPH)
MYDLLIIGAGPAGLSAAVYAARYKMNFAVIGSNIGGLANDAHLVGNWLGDKEIQGKKLAENFVEHVKSLDGEVIAKNVDLVEKTDQGFKVSCGKDEYETKRLLLATGTARNKLGAKNEDELLGKGVSYCATCDGFFFKEKTVAVIGGGDSALNAALYLSDIAKKVYLVHRRNEFRAEPICQANVKNCQNIETVLEATVSEIVGENKVEKIIFGDGKELEVDGVFVEIGNTPITTLVAGLGVKTDDQGYIIVDKKQQTTADKVWAAGDITTASSKLKQIIVAASEGAIAAYNAYLDTKSA